MSLHSKVAVGSSELTRNLTLAPLRCGASFVIVVSGGSASGTKLAVTARESLTIIVHVS
jgi:hypothetical protein